MNTLISGIVGLLVSMALMLFVMPHFIKYLKRLNLSQAVSEYALEEFKEKAKTPIMGGLLFVLIPVVVFIFIARKNLDSRILFVILAYLSFCLVGFLDDFMIILEHTNEGLSPLSKLVMETIFTVTLYLLFNDDLHECINIPFVNGGITLAVPIFVVFMVIMFLGEANAVNFTDGMDGLCAGLSVITCIGFIILCCKAKEYVLVILLTCVLGGLFGYLFFNWHPAKIFMGDSGSLALGALFASIALLLQDEVALLLLGGVYLIEMGCVCIQQISVRLFHKKIFLYTPIHYAFVLKGHKETHIVIAFYIVGIILTAIGVFVGLH